MGHCVTAIRTLADQFALWMLAPLAIFILISGVDDLIVDLLWLRCWLRRVLFRHPPLATPPAAGFDALPEKRIAIFVPLWREHDVIVEMLAHNIAQICYREYDFFVGVYPNDRATVDAVDSAERRFGNVHMALCPHDGPTSKPDCLNWIYQCMLGFEAREGVRFDIVVTHDAEDLIHPESLRCFNHYCSDFGFVQIPVLALRTPLLALTHGVYCDEFAEFQTRDLPVRNQTGAFVPSAGVGTAYSREALELLAASDGDRIFDPGCLTEDYENGCRLHSLGVRQLFVPVADPKAPVATREFFPQRLKPAIRQRTRWVTGIALQGWERHGWRGGFRQAYWFWRDRKGLVASPLGLLTNILCAYGLATRMWDRVTPPENVSRLLAWTLLFQVIHLTVRMYCTGRLYGFVFSLMTPVRAIFGNIINGVSAVRAVVRYANAKARGRQLAWVKTAHAYPDREALLTTRRRIGEILVGLGYLDQRDLDEALAVKPPTVRTGEFLIALGAISDDELYEGLAIQQMLPIADVVPGQVTRKVARALPALVTSRWRVAPFRVEAGRLDVACSEPPAAPLKAALKAHTSLTVRFHLITPEKFKQLAARCSAR